MSDPFDRLREALGDVPVPDQWPAIEARAAAGELPGAPAAPGRGHPLAWWAAAAAALALVVTGVVVLAARQTADAPATPPPGETVPPPDPSLPCRSEQDLATISTVLEAGQPEVASDPLPEFPALMGRNPHVVLVGSVVSVSRTADGFTRLELAETPKYLRGAGPVDAISFRSEWNDTANRDPLAVPIEVRGAMIVAFARSLSSSQVWVADPDALYLGCAGTTVPAVGVRGIVPSFLGGSIDDIATQVSTALTGATIPTTPSPIPPTTESPTGAMPCASDADLDAVVGVIPGGAVTDYDPADDVAELIERADTVVRARLVSADRNARGRAVLHLAEVVTLAGEETDLTTVDLGTTWTGDRPSADPLADPVTFDGVEMLVFALRVNGVPPKWVPTPQGVFAACTGGSSYVRPLREPAPFLEHSSLDAMAEQVITTAPADAGPWGRLCIDQTGPAEPPASDPLADAPFGPLASEPGLTVLYPFGALDPMYSAPMSSVARVPGGLLIRLDANGPDGGQIVAVVDDRGSVRWRRCLPDDNGWSMVVDDGVAHLEMVAPDGFNTTEWWSFDLATGASSIDTAPPAGLPIAADSPPPIEFHADDPASGQAPLRRLAADGSEVWRRDDLLDPLSEGIRVSAPQATAAGDVVLVRACTGPLTDTVTAGELPCPYALLGIDVDDGSTVWQVDGFYSVSLVADGLAIVRPTPGLRQPSQLLDLATGEFVPGGVSDAAGAFYEECCGGYDFNRVESAGALAWTIAYDRLNVWFPAGSPGPGVTVDLLGPATEPFVAARAGLPADDAPGCGDNCAYISFSAGGFTPGATVRAGCWTDAGGEWAPSADAADLVVAPDGSVGATALCTHGRGSQLKVVVDGVESGIVVL